VRVAPASSQVIYPLRVTAITVDYEMPATRARVPATFRVLSVSSATGKALSGWTATASSPELTALSLSIAVASTTAPPMVISSRLAAALAVAALPVLVAAVVIARRPDPATELRTAEAA